MKLLRLFSLGLVGVVYIIIGGLIINFAVSSSFIGDVGLVLKFMIIVLGAIFILIPFACLLTEYINYWRTYENTKS